MKFEHRHILITGASGGIGAALAQALARRGARLLLHGRNRQALEALAGECETLGSPDVRICCADLATSEGRQQLTDRVATDFAQLDTLINNAGIGCFELFEQQTPARIEQLIATNISAPILLTRQLLERLLAASEPRILNIGSAFGAIGYPGYTTYCAGKGALRLFSEALARELSDTPLRVQYLAPRATRTAINSDRAQAMLEATGGRSDSPETVARAAIDLLSSGRARAAVGWPEKVLVRLNGLYPELISAVLRRQLAKIKPFARTTETGV